MDPSVPNGTSTNSRKRPRDHETPSQRLKREKAAERQRRKRERDRNAAGMGIMAFAQSQDQQQQQPPQPQMAPPPHSVPPQQPIQPDFGQELTPEELSRREKVRAAARERQRKHRQLVKQRKMRELGLDMGNEIISGMEEVHYRVNAEGQYQPVIPHELQPPPHHPPPPMGQQEPPFPQGQPLGGQTFASTLLLSFSCAPLLKQHLLRTLNMTNEELASLEPVIAEAWDHWDHQRRLHYAEHAAKNGAGMPPGPPPFPVEMPPHEQHPGAPPHGHPFPPPPTGTDPAAHPGTAQNEFRARFHRPLVAPTPFGAYEAQPNPGPPSAAAATPAATTTPTSTSGSAPGPPSDPIDPHLSGANGTTTKPQAVAAVKIEVRS